MWLLTSRLFDTVYLFLVYQQNHPRGFVVYQTTAHGQVKRWLQNCLPSRFFVVYLMERPGEVKAQIAHKRRILNHCWDVYICKINHSDVILLFWNCSYIKIKIPFKISWLYLTISMSLTSDLILDKFSRLFESISKIFFRRIVTISLCLLMSLSSIMRVTASWCLILLAVSSFVSFNKQKYYFIGSLGGLTNLKKLYICVPCHALVGHCRLLCVQRLQVRK